MKEYQQKSLGSDVPVYFVNYSTGIERKMKTMELVRCAPSQFHPYGLVIQCNDVECIYEFSFFQKKKKTSAAEMSVNY